MKIKIIAAVFCLLTLCSCRGIDSYREPEQVAVISSVGFDIKDNKYFVTLETVEDGKTETLSASSLKVSEAFYNLQRNTAKSLFYGHTSVIILGESLGEKEIDEILAYCKENRDITLACRVVSTENANKLLSDNEENIGKKIVTLITNREKEGEKIDCTLYRVLKSRSSIYYYGN